MNKFVLTKVGGCVIPSPFSECRGPGVSQLLPLTLQSFSCKTTNGPELQLSGKLTHSLSALEHRVGKQKEIQLTHANPTKHKHSFMQKRFATYRWLSHKALQREDETSIFYCFVNTFPPQHQSFDLPICCQHKS